MRNLSLDNLVLSVRSADTRVELAASALIAKAVGASDRVPLPIPIDAWIERPLGFSFEIVGADQLPAGALGLARPSLGEILVHEELLEHEGRFRFTCAHELGHLMLHGAEPGEFSDAELPRSDEDSQVEREANRFASAMLMPLRVLSAQIAAAARSSDLDPACGDLLRGNGPETVWLWRRCLLPALCESFGVSRAAMIYRCRELRLPGKHRLVRPSLVPLLAAPEPVLAPLRLNEFRLIGGRPVLP